MDKAKQFGDFWKGGSYLFTQTPKNQTISVKWKSGTVADYPSRTYKDMVSDSQVSMIVDNRTGEILLDREYSKKNSTGHVTDL